MRMRLRAAAGRAVLLVLGTGPAWAQGKPVCDGQGKVKTPERIEGQVVKGDPGQGQVAVREADGTVHALQASAETLHEPEVGDRIGARLRETPKCP